MIAHVTVRTAQQEETVAFYQWLLGLPVSREVDTPTGTIQFLGGGETQFEIIPDESAKKVNAKGLSIGFMVGDLEEKLAMLDSRRIPHSQIIVPHPGARFVFFTDLNGCEIQLFEGKE